MSMITHMITRSQKKHMYNQLVNAIIKNDDTKIKNLIKEGVDLNGRYYIKEVYKNNGFYTSWETSLTMAKDWRSSKKVVKILKDNGAQ